MIYSRLYINVVEPAPVSVPPYIKNAGVIDRSLPSDKTKALWEKETANANGKIAGRACYNMAIISEINGDLDQSIQWAQKAYEDYNNRLALRYIDILNYRKNSDRILESQGQ